MALREIAEGKVTPAILDEADRPQVEEPSEEGAETDGATGAAAEGAEAPADKA